MPDVSGALLSGRLVAEALMQDFGVMRSPAGRSTQNSDGEEIPVYNDEFTSPCKVSGASTGGSEPTYRTITVGGVERDLITAGLRLPIDVPPCQRGWVFEVTAVGPSSDPRLVGRKYYVHNDPAKSFATARRLDVAEV